MIVPTYTNTAKNVTGVAGQQFGFKVPGGVLSAPMVAEANLYQNMSTVAGQAGGYFLQQYHNTAVSGAVNEAAPHLDSIAIAASQLNPMDKNPHLRPLNWYSRQSSAVLKQAQGASWWPATKAAIGSQVGGLVKQQTRALKKETNLRMLSYSLGELETFRATQEHQIAIGMTPGWKGDPEKLQGDAYIGYKEAIKASRLAAESKIISFADHAQYERELLSESSALAIEQRMLAADNPDASYAARIKATRDLFAEVSNNKNWAKLEDPDRQNLKEQLQNQLTSLLAQEEGELRRIDAKERRETKKDQAKTYGDTMSRIFAHQGNKQGAKEVTVEELIKLQGKGQITGEQLGALRNLLENKIPSESNLALVDRLNRDLIGIATSRANAQEVEEQVGAVLDEVTGEVVKGRNSLISRTDYQALHTRAANLLADRGAAGGWKRIESLLREVARKGKEFVKYADAPRYLEAIAAAQDRWWQGGANATAEALQRGLNILASEPEDAARDMSEKEGPSYPKFLPLPKKLGISSADPDLWKPDDLAKAWAFYEQTGWTVDIPGQAFNADKRDNLYEQLQAIEVWMEAVAKAKAQAEAEKAKN